METIYEDDLLPFFFDFLIFFGPYLYRLLVNKAVDGESILHKNEEPSVGRFWYYGGILAANGVVRLLAELLATFSAPSMRRKRASLLQPLLTAS